MRLHSLVAAGLIFAAGLGGCGKDRSTNYVPVADAGADRIVAVNEVVAIRGTGSDKDGVITGYIWKEGSEILSREASFNYVPSTSGEHTLSLSVVDNDGMVGTDSMVVYSSELGTVTRPLVVIRVEFNDYHFRNTAPVWGAKLFGMNDSQLNNYFNEISYGKFYFVKAEESDGHQDGIITVSLNENHPNEIEKKQDRMVSAIQLADKFIDFSQYDTAPADGRISANELQIMFLFAGGELSTSNGHPGIWAHSWCMDGAINVTPPTLDGVSIMSCRGKGTYAAFGEKHFGAINGNDATIGVIAHELGHSLFDLPDLYDTDGDSAGIGYFGLMGSGCWGRRAEAIGNADIGATPVHMTGWSKMQSGFVTPTIIDQVTLGLKVNATSSLDYVLYQLPTGRVNEYFLIENRNNSGYDRGLAGLVSATGFNGGLSVLHVDHNLFSNCVGSNTCNENQTHKLVDVEEANNEGLDTDPNYAGNYNNLFFFGNNESFTDWTFPNSKRYDGVSSGVGVENISLPGAVMKADLYIENN